MSIQRSERNVSESGRTPNRAARLFVVLLTWLAASYFYLLRIDFILGSILYMLGAILYGSLLVRPFSSEIFLIGLALLLDFGIGNPPLGLAAGLFAGILFAIDLIIIMKLARRRKISLRGRVREEFWKEARKHEVVNRIWTRLKSLWNP